MARVLVIVAQLYNANELWPMLKTLQQSGHEWFTAATESVIIDERTRKPYRVNELLKNIRDVSQYQGIAFVSGEPKSTYAHWSDKYCHAIVEEAMEHEAAFAGICASVPALWKAIDGVKVSAFPLRVVLGELTGLGAIYRNVSLTVDKKVSTAENEAMALMWAKNFIALLEGREPEYLLHQSPFKRKGRPMRKDPAIEYLKKNRKVEDDDVSSK
jgi:putative intracellular protease/amidase